MKIKLVLFIVIFLPIIIYSQTKYHFDFEKLNIIDTIRTSGEIETLKGDFRFDNLFVRTIRNKKNEDVSALIFKKEKHWLVADLEIYSQNNTANLVAVSSDFRYAYVISEGNHSARQTETAYKSLHCIDMMKNLIFSGAYYDYMFYWEPSKVTDFEYEKLDYLIDNSQIIIDENHITVLNSFFCNFQKNQQQSNVIQSGKYKIDEGKLIKIRNYDPNSMQLKSIQYMGNIAVGMTTEEVQELHPNVKFIESANPYSDCADDNETGFEIWDGNELLGYSGNPLSEGIKDNLIVISPKFYFGSLHVSSTLSQVLKLYPNAKIIPNLLSDWEHIYIKELNIELTFKTNNDTRIGIYKDEEFVKWKNKKKQVDYIKLLNN